MVEDFDPVAHLEYLHRKQFTKKAKYKISAVAINDLDEIWEYTFMNWSKKQADRYHKLLISLRSHLSLRIEPLREIYGPC